jgi:hypothetical protein
MIRHRLHPILAVLLAGICPAQAQTTYQETFDDETLWPTSGYAYYLHGAYHIKAEEGRMCYYDGKLFDDFEAEIRTEFLDGPDVKGYGLMFRTRDYDNYYEFCVSANGYFRLAGQKRDQWFELIPWTAHTAIQQSGVNYLKVQCRGEKIDLFINGTEVASARDRRFVKGHVGVLAYSNAHVHFDDLMVDSPGRVPARSYYFELTEVDREGDYPLDPSVVLVENFSDRSGKWSESDFAHYERGYYRMNDPNNGRFSWQYGSLEDFEVEGRIRVSRWPREGTVGVTARILDEKNYYAMLLTKEKEFMLEKCYEGALRRLVMPAPVSFVSDSILTLGLRCSGDEFTLLLNGRELIQARDPDRPLRGTNFGFYASKGLSVDVLAVQVKRLPFAWGSVLFDFGDYWWLWVLVAAALYVPIRLYRRRSAKEGALRRQRATQVIDLIRSHQGTLSMGDVMVYYKISKRAASQLMEQVMEDYGGVGRVTSEGGLLYDFPDFMPTEEKMLREIIVLAGRHEGRVTVTEAAGHLHKDIVETETMLDGWVDGKRVRRVSEEGITYYEFVEILVGKKKR